MLWIILGIAISYLIGSIPTAYIFGRVLKGIDIRKFGSGNVGATNAMRLLGKGPGISVLVLDALKGFVAVICVGGVVASKAGFISSEIAMILSGVSCIAGHNWTIFLGFKGGKGMATSLGVLLGLSVKIAGLKTVLVTVVFIWLAVFLIGRIVSIASILSALALPVLMLVFKQSNALILLSFLLSALVILRHKANLKRIFSGTEPRISFKKNQK